MSLWVWLLPPLYRMSSAKALEQKLNFCLFQDRFPKRGSTESELRIYYWSKIMRGRTPCRYTIYSHKLQESSTDVLDICHFCSFSILLLSVWHTGRSCPGRGWVSGITEHRVTYISGLIPPSGYNLVLIYSYTILILTLSEWERNNGVVREQEARINCRQQLNRCLRFIVML